MNQSNKRKRFKLITGRVDHPGMLEPVIQVTGEVKTEEYGPDGARTYICEEQVAVSEFSNRECDPEAVLRGMANNITNALEERERLCQK